jgi:hypothetical protein
MVLPSLMVFDINTSFVQVFPRFFNATKAVLEIDLVAGAHDFGTGSIGTGARFVPSFLSAAKQSHRTPVGAW